jgi:hypothetical protein
MTDAEFWDVERGLWLGGLDDFRRWVSADGVMVFPEPVGILAGEAILDSVGGAPRWRQVNFRGPVLRRGGTEAAVLAYRAEAERADGTAYRALCSSSYIRDAGDWWLVQHQQTPD